MSKIKLVLRPSRINKEGEMPICIRITKDRNTRFIFLDHRIKENDWNQNDQCVESSNPNADAINFYLSTKLAEVKGKTIEMDTREKAAKPKELKNFILGRTGQSFLKFFDRTIQEMELGDQVGTTDKLKSVRKKIVKYVGKGELMFDDITVSWLKSYELYLRATLKNKTNTIHSNLKVIRKIINDAIREELIPFDKNPFQRYKLKLESTQKEFLTEDELRSLELLELTEGSMKEHHRNMYVFAAYAAGLRISDILQLRWSNFDGEKILVHTKKTSTTVSIKLPGKSLEIINKYKTTDCKPHDFIFPILKNDIDYKNPRLLDRSISVATAYTNNDLKDFAKMAGINKNLHFHTSRHTWATRALRKGMPIQYVSKLLGHTSIKTTQIYTKIVNDDLDNAMAVFN